MVLDKARHERGHLDLLLGHLCEAYGGMHVYVATDDVNQLVFLLKCQQKRG